MNCESLPIWEAFSCIFGKSCGIVKMVLPINGKRAAPQRVSRRENVFFAPSDRKKGGQWIMVTYSDMFQFCMLIVAVISLVVKVCNSKKK